MPLKRAILLPVALLAVSIGFAGGLPEGMTALPAGVFRPLFALPQEPVAVPVKPFLMDRLPVTNGDYLKFIEAVPAWRRSKVKRLFADENYLKHWRGDLDPGDVEALARPVVWVSWFAAKAYAQWSSKRLPTVAEWEYAAAASPTRVDGENDAVFQNALRLWYTTPSPETLSRAGASVPNAFGLRDLHGLVWEWTSDFNSSLVSGDARGDNGLDRQLFCGAGSAEARDTANFPAFMRYGFRSSLKAAYTVHNLGFRCAKDP